MVFRGDLIENAAGRIRGAVVNDDQLEVEPLAREDRAHRCGDRGLFVAGRNDDAQNRTRVHGTNRCRERKTEQVGNFISIPEERDRTHQPPHPYEPGNGDEAIDNCDVEHAHPRYSRRSVSCMRCRWAADPTSLSCKHPTSQTRDVGHHDSNRLSVPRMTPYSWSRGASGSTRGMHPDCRACRALFRSRPLR